LVVVVNATIAPGTDVGQHDAINRVQRHGAVAAE
jgi:hypothetical protein